MTRQTEFQQKLLKLLHEYGVEVSVEEVNRNYCTYVEGINFYSRDVWDGVELIHMGFYFTWPASSLAWRVE